MVALIIMPNSGDVDIDISSIFTRLGAISIFLSDCPRPFDRFGMMALVARCGICCLDTRSVISRSRSSAEEDVGFRGREVPSLRKPMYGVEASQVK